MSFGSVAVLGLGKVGLLAATFLDEAGFEVIGIDQRAPRQAASFETRVCDIADPAVLHSELGAVEAVLSCLPYHLNRSIAEAAHRLGI
ncbi:MAG: saccharopine dehydrogenase NADP-binding domain-containing protein, partial [Ilumatobacteraceae bacterium]